MKFIKSIWQFVVAIFMPPVIYKAVRTVDTAFAFRMGAGFPGDVNRSHPVSIEPVQWDATQPPTEFGVPVVLDATTHNPRKMVAGDDALTDAWGVVVRPYPTQQSTGGMTSSFGSGGPNATQPGDVMKAGYIMVQLSNFAAQPCVKGGAVYVWTAVSTGNHVQGRFEAAATGGSTAALNTTKFHFNGPPDANGVAEVIVTL